MKQAILVAAIVAMALPARAQFGGLDGLKKLQQAKQKFDDLNVSDEEEQQIGARGERRRSASASG